MVGTPWTLEDEQFIVETAGKLTLRDMADNLGRSYASVRRHVQDMRAAGRLTKDTRIYGEQHWISNLKVCPSCLTPRSKFNKDGICTVCHKKASLEEHERKMHRSYENLPKELKDRTNGTFRIERNKKLMSKSKDLREPMPPSTTGMDQFEAGMAIEEFNIAHEEYELARLVLDIDAVKQRRSKWNKKAARWRREHGIECPSDTETANG